MVRVTDIRTRLVDTGDCSLYTLEWTHLTKAQMTWSDYGSGVKRSFGAEGREEDVEEEDWHFFLSLKFFFSFWLRRIMFLFRSVFSMVWVFQHRVFKIYCLYNEKIFYDFLLHSSLIHYRSLVGLTRSDNPIDSCRVLDVFWHETLHYDSLHTFWSYSQFRPVMNVPPGNIIRENIREF